MCVYIRSLTHAIKYLASWEYQNKDADSAVRALSQVGKDREVKAQ